MKCTPCTGNQRFPFLPSCLIRDFDVTYQTSLTCANDSYSDMFCTFRSHQILERNAIVDCGSLRLGFICFGEHSSWGEERCGFGGECLNLSRHVVLISQ